MVAAWLMGESKVGTPEKTSSCTNPDSVGDRGVLIFKASFSNEQGFIHHKLPTVAELHPETTWPLRGAYAGKNSDQKVAEWPPIFSAPITTNAIEIEFSAPWSFYEFARVKQISSEASPVTQNPTA